MASFEQRAASERDMICAGYDMLALLVPEQVRDLVGALRDAHLTAHDGLVARALALQALDLNVRAMLEKADA